MAEVFGFDQNTQEVNDFKFITVTKETAIQENIYFEDIKLEKWEGKEDYYLEVTVRNDKGQTANRRYSEPKLDGNIVKDEAGLKKANDKFLKIAKNMATKVLGDNAVLGGSNFVDFCTKFIASIKAKPNWNKIPMRCVFVHDNNGYTKLRSYSPIFELMTVPKDKSALVVGTYDNYTVKQTPSTEAEVATTGTEAEVNNIF